MLAAGEIIEQYLEELPAYRADEPDHAPRDESVTGRVEELVVAPATVDDLRRKRDQREGRDEVGDLVVARDRLEEVPQKAGPVEGRADQDEGYDPAARHPLTASDLLPTLPPPLIPGRTPS